MDSTAVREWLEGTRGSPIPTGLAVDEALLRAEEIWRKLFLGTELGKEFDEGDGTPDVLHALSRLLKRDRSGPFGARFRAIVSLYDVIEQCGHALPDADERHDLRARFAYLAWDACRRDGRCRDMRIWENRCVENVIAQESIRDFLKLRFEQRSENLNRRFLSDPTVVLTVCRQLAVKVNPEPALVAREAPEVFQWLTKSNSESEETSYFAADLALCAAGALRHISRFREAGRWADCAERWFHETANNLSSVSRVDHFRLTLLYDMHRNPEVLERLPRVLADLERFDLADELSKCRLLEAFALKGTGRIRESLQRLQDLERSADVRKDPLVLGLTLVNVAELTGERGQFAEALKTLDEAIPLLKAAGAEWAFAGLEAVLGQLLRERGRLEEAIEAYRAAASRYSQAQSDGHASYIRILLAETLIAAGREREATAEILAALPLIEREAVIPDAIVALALLKEALRRQGADATSVRAMRLQLEKIREGAQ